MPLGYGLQSFCNDLKAVLIKTGVEGQPVCLFLESHQLVNPGFLECVNSLLTGGEVNLQFLYVGQLVCGFLMDTALCSSVHCTCCTSSVMLGLEVAVMLGSASSCCEKKLLQGIICRVIRSYFSD